MNSGDGDDEQSLAVEARDAIVLYDHPLQALESIGNLYPIADIQDNPASGKRYAVQDLSVFNTDGTVVRTSGVIEVDIRTMTVAEKAAIQTAKGPITPPSGHEQVGAALLAALASVPSTTKLEINLFLVTEDVEPAFVTIEKEIARGNIITQADVDAKHQELIDEAEFRASTVQSLVASDIRNLGGMVTGTCDTMPCMFATMQAGQIASLIGHPDIAAMELNGKVVPDALLTGTQVIRGSQVKQFIDAGYDGEFSTGTDLRFAVIEIDNYVDTHPGFKDTSASGARISARFNCTSGVCASTPSFSLPASQDPEHPTLVAGIIFGDLRDAQDPAVASATGRVDRSGYAGEAWGVLYRAIASADGAGGGASTLQAMNHLVATASRPKVVNIASSVENEDPQCKGQTPGSLAVNSLFQAGTLVFKSASNTGHASTTDCTVGAPGAAIGAFTVGAHGHPPADWNGTETNVRTSSIDVVSARGGTTTEGGRRSIIDLTGFSWRVGLFDISGGYDNGSFGTSVATPTVTGAALDFIDMYKRVKMSNLIDNPGMLYVNMLMMGDRQGASGKLTSQFDNLYGAGRMMMRTFTASGIDAPGVWASNFVCVGQDEVVTIPINSGNLIDSEADIFKAAIYWYDRRHAKGVAIDDIDLDLTYVSNGNSLVHSASSYDNKERVFYQGIGNKAVQLEISGYTVTADDEGCGTNKQRVYYAYFYEDDARNDADGPLLVNIQKE